MGLEASEDQFGAPFLYGSAREGYFMHSPDGEREGLTALLETIVSYVPPLPGQYSYPGSGTTGPDILRNDRDANRFCEESNN